MHHLIVKNVVRLLAVLMIAGIVLFSWTVTR